MRKAALFLVLLGVGCGDDTVTATFTSRVVQHEICRVIGSRPETCEREESLLDLRVRIDEQEDQNVWLYGIPRGGVADRAILGSRDVDGGFLFIDERTQANNASGCTLTDRIEISLLIDPEADETLVGTDPCVPLVGREVEVTTSSSGCDTVNNPPLEQTLTARRRWEPPPTCTP
jgi:hypothetical protein